MTNEERKRLLQAMAEHWAILSRPRDEITKIKYKGYHILIDYCFKYKCGTGMVFGIKTDKANPLPDVNEIDSILYKMGEERWKSLVDDQRQLKEVLDDLERPLFGFSD